MKKSILIVILSLLLIIIITATIVFIVSNKQEKKEINNGNENVTINSVPTVSEIKLNSKQYINSLETIKINGTNDTLKITEKVKWEVPEHEKDETVDFAMAIPYTITVDGQDYKGTYILESSSDSIANDKNPKYNFEVTDLTKDGEIEVLVTKK